MNDTLKVAGRIGAELGAAKAANEKLRGLLRECRPAVQREVEKWTRASAILPVNANTESALLSRIDAALSQQAEPTDTYTAVDMATAAAQGFRDGQAAVEPAAAQDETEPVYQFQWREIGEGDWMACSHSWFRFCEASPEHDTRVVEVARPAQTEQQPVAVPESWWQLIHDTLRNYRMGTLDDGFGDGYPLIDAMTADGQPVSGGIQECTYLADEIWNALRVAPIAQAAPQPEQSA